MRNFYPQIADSTLLSPVFVFDDDSLKKDTVSSDTNFRATAHNHDSVSLTNDDTTQIPQISRASSSTPLSTNHSPAPTENRNLPTSPAFRDTFAADTTTVDSSNLPEPSVPPQNTTTHRTLISTRFDGVRQIHSSNTFFLIELVLAFMLVGVRIYQQRLFRKFLRAFFSLTVLNDLHNESKTYSTPVFWIGLLNYIIQAAFFAAFYSNKITVIDWNNTFQLGAIIFTFNIAKYVVYRISGIIFDKNELFANYGLYHFITLFIAGIWLFIINILFFYTIPEPEILNIGAYLFAILLISKQLAFVFLSLHQKVSGFHIFLYLCTLEILPFIVAYNWFNL